MKASGLTSHMLKPFIHFERGFVVRTRLHLYSVSSLFIFRWLIRQWSRSRNADGDYNGSCTKRLGSTVWFWNLDRVFYNHSPSVVFTQVFLRGNLPKFIQGVYSVTGQRNPVISQTFFFLLGKLLTSLCDAVTTFCIVTLSLSPTERPKQDSSGSYLSHQPAHLGLHFHRSGQCAGPHRQHQLHAHLQLHWLLLLQCGYDFPAANQREGGPTHRS